MAKKRKILITGASGFIGSRVCREFPNAEVVVIVSPFSKCHRLDDLQSRVKKITVDISNYDDVQKLFSEHNPEVVVHLATHGVYGYQQKDEERIVVGNYKMAFNLLKISSKTGVKRFVNTGSVFEYGSQKGRVKEEQVNLDDILNKYSAVKMATTALAESFSDQLSVVTVRPFTAYGPGGDKSRFVMATILRALKNEDIRIVEGVRRDFVYVEDLANGIAKAAKADIKSGEIINLASGKAYSLEEVSKLIKKACSSKSKIIVDEQYKRNKESRCWADISKAKRLLKWQPRHSLEQGLQETIEWARAVL